MKPKYTSFFLLLTALVLCSSKSNAQYINTFAGNGTSGYSGDGRDADYAELSGPTGVATYGYVTQYIADLGNHVVRKIDYRRTITTFAGNGSVGNSGDGGLASAATLNAPFALAVDPLNNVYIADYAANVVRMVSSSGIITTVAGNDTAGYSGDGGLAIHAQLNHPCGLALDAAGNLYIADAQNNVVRKVNTSGIISTYAGDAFGAGLPTGHGGYSGDGAAATAARLNFPEGLAMDVFGNLFIADQSNNVVRKVSKTGIISTYAGTGYIGSHGDGGPAVSAQLNAPTGVAVDGLGNLYIADEGNNTIRKVTLSGTITTIAGLLSSGYMGDGGPATVALLDHPAGLTVDGNGLVYVADYSNNTIRLIGPASILVSVKSVLNPAGSDINLYPNPSKGSFTIEIPGNNDEASINVFDVFGRIVATGKMEGAKASFDLGNIPSGGYIVSVVQGNNIYRQQLQVTAN